MADHAELQLFRGCAIAPPRQESLFRDPTTGTKTTIREKITTANKARDDGKMGNENPCCRRQHQRESLRQDWGRSPTQQNSGEPPELASPASRQAQEHQDDERDGRDHKEAKKALNLDCTDTDNVNCYCDEKN